MNCATISFSRRTLTYGFTYWVNKWRHRCLQADWRKKEIYTQPYSFSQMKYFVKQTRFATRGVAMALSTTIQYFDCPFFKKCLNGLYSRMFVIVITWVNSGLPPKRQETSSLWLKHEGIQCCHIDASGLVPLKRKEEMLHDGKTRRAQKGMGCDAE